MIPESPHLEPVTVSPLANAEAMPIGSQTDRFHWRPLIWSVVVAGIAVAILQILNFVPAGTRSIIGQLRDLAGILFFIAGPLVGVFIVAWLVRSLVAALVRLQFRRALSLLCAAIALPLAIFGALRCPLLGPYYWYVVSNQARFEELIKAASHSGSPALVRLEERDVSTGLATDAPTFASIVYDESDELGRAPMQRSPTWYARSAGQLSENEAGARKTQLLCQHIYVVFWGWAEFRPPT